ncbi:hypothetical protein BJV82DRAFT_577807 [Fennellomyces sp. T-0311]|nr:hypothetical protein BJV82DRAFT_577807 [Fennellomyces sp. T-0311]
MKQDDEGADEITKNDENEKEKKKRESTERRKKLAEFREQEANLLKKRKREQAAERAEQKRLKQEKNDDDPPKDRSHPYNVPKKLNLNSLSKESLARLRMQPDDVHGVYNPKADGHCGWRSVSFVTNEDEEAYDTVKEAMRSIMMHKVDFYQDHGIDVDRAAKRLKKLEKLVVMIGLRLSIALNWLQTFISAQ